LQNEQQPTRGYRRSSKFPQRLSEGSGEFVREDVRFSAQPMGEALKPSGRMSDLKRIGIFCLNLRIDRSCVVSDRDNDIWFRCVFLRICRRAIMTDPSMGRLKPIQDSLQPPNFCRQTMSNLDLGVASINRLSASLQPVNDLIKIWPF
jgi:hypothetical protein